MKFSSREQAQAYILKLIRNWKAPTHFTIPTNCIWITGPSGSGKSHGVIEAIRELSDKYHDVVIHGAEPLTLFQKRLKMKDVRCLCTTPVFLFDPFDTMLATDKGFVSALVKVLKDLEKNQGHGSRLCILVGSTSVDRKMGDFKRLIPDHHIVQFCKNDPQPNISKSEKQDDVIYDTREFYECKDWSRMNQFLSQDPWLSPLTILDEMRHALRKKRAICSNLLDTMIVWGKLCNINPDDFFMGELSILTTCFISLYIHILLQGHEDTRTDLLDELEDTANTAGNNGAFTKLLTLHSVRKRAWKEKQDSGLPWMYDVHRRLGSKFSASTVRSGLCLNK